MPSAIRKHSHHIDKKLRFRLRMYFAISLILIGLLIYDVLNGSLRLDFGIVGLIVGIVLGVFASRMFHTSWDKDAKKVVSRLDTFGIFLLIIYISFSLIRGRIIAYFTNNVDVATIGFAVLAGVMIGRLMGTRGKIIKVLKEERVFRK